jgi:hypothetical protein
VPPTPLQRTGCACLTIAAAQFVAAGVERARLKSLLPGTSQQRPVASGEGASSSSSLSVAWTVPQYCLVGVSEFFYVAAIEFFFEQSPPRLRSLASALLLSAFGVANLVNGGVVALAGRVTDWIPSSSSKGSHSHIGIGTRGGGPSSLSGDNPGRLDLYFCAMGAFSLLNFALFAWPVAGRYRYYDNSNGCNNDDSTSDVDSCSNATSSVVSS